MEPLVQLIRRLGDDVRDGDLVRRFADGDQAAFAELVRRHGRLVLGVCRRVLHHAHDAEDACQAVFVLLARKAAGLRDPDRLTAWLHGVAVRVARKARALRRRQQERDAARPVPVTAGPDRLLDDLLADLDEGLHALPARYRETLILHYLEGLTQAETARRLNCPPGTVAARLSRGRELLRRSLARRGVAVSASAVAALLGRAEAASAGCVVTALVPAVPAAGGLVQTLVHGVTMTLLLERIRQTTLAVALGVACLVLPGWAVYHAAAGDPPPTAFAPPPLAPLPPADPDAVAASQTANFRVTAPSARLSQLVAQTAEKERAELAKTWLGKELPDWPKPCLLTVRLGESHSHATFSYEKGTVTSREIHVSGTVEQILAALVAHEVMHAVLADHFGQQLPRWADEGIALLAEDATNQDQHRAALLRLVGESDRLPQGLGIFLERRDYPSQKLPDFYSQSHGVCDFLLGRKGHATLIAFVGDGLKSGWPAAAKKHYGFADLRALEDEWLTVLKKHPAFTDAATARLVQQLPKMPPQPVLATVSADGKFVQTRTPTPVYEPVTTYVREGGQVRAAQTSYTLRNAENRMIMPLDRVALRTAGGKTFTPDELRARLKEPTVCVSIVAGPLPEAYLKLLRDDTLILTVPAEPLALPELPKP